MKTVFAPVLLGLLTTTLVASGASARQDSQPQQHMQSAAQREARQDRAQQDRAHDRAQLRADRERSQRDRLHQQAERARARIEAQGNQARQAAAKAQAQAAAQAAQQQRQAQRARAQAEAQAQHAKLEARLHRERREERRARDSSHQPFFLPTNALFAAAALHQPKGQPGAASGADVVRASVAPVRVVPAPRPDIVPASAAAGLAAMRGDQLMREGEIAAARLQYQDAVAAGSAHAAVGLGRSFDPSVLAALGAASSDGDSLAAAVWYQRAQMMGNHEADAALRMLNARPAN